MRYALWGLLFIWMQTVAEEIRDKANKANLASAARAGVRKAGLLPLVFVMYAYATGGPFGLEDMVTTSGPGLTLLYHLFIPFFWCIPVSLVAAELTTAIPVELLLVPLGVAVAWMETGRFLVLVRHRPGRIVASVRPEVIPVSERNPAS